MTAVPQARPNAGNARRRGPLTLGRGSLIALVVVIAAMLATTTYRSDSQAAPGQAAKFDAAKYGADTYKSKVVPAIRKNAVDIVTLQKALAADSDAAGKKYGHRDGTGLYSFAVTFTGTAGKATSGILPITVPGISKARVSVQIGPAINGTALRDAVGFIKFGQFVNQVDYADAGTALNNQMKAAVLAHLNVASLQGKKVTVIGATSPLTADLLTVTPISIEPTP
ncbi:DUF2291 family protein [Streptomyces brasiliensis]|uniref:Lipoprotein n=1 Tax=Streptomyces brasiliensis TaxID=1954 RepID=A0A917KUV3_9ACTN|nr:DUF2291 domain-containing protein [Streptomyces brasiliensis]GGJ29024.1 lipoprotein [Streptomyces brasiliensis]